MGCACLLLGASGATRQGSGQSASDPKPARRLDAPPAGSVAPFLGAGESVTLKGGHLAIVVPVPAGGATEAWLTRFVDAGNVAALRRKLGDRLPTAGQPLRIPLAFLNDAYRFKAVRDLFPRDAARQDDWVHVVGRGRLSAEQESLSVLAEAYTAGPENASLLGRMNPAAGAKLKPGTEIVIPALLLHSAFPHPTARIATAERPSDAPAGRPSPERASDLAVLPPLEAASQGADEPEDDFTEAPSAAEEEGAPTPGPAGPPGPPAWAPIAEGANELQYGEDAEGRYAAYRLKKGEALYSAVVVRFTGRIDIQEVNDLTARVARRSGIDQVTNIPIGFKVRIPLDVLLPEYLPRDDSRRQAWERQQAEVARYTNVATSRGLSGVAVILDAGHGGRDIGAAHNGVWEHDYVYDILCRVKALLESQTGARVFTTIRDQKEGYQIHETARLTRSRAEVLLTNPPFALSERAPSVNLRWYLSNAYYRRLVEEGVDPLKIVFTSLHADARHPALAGAMVYVPGEEFRRGRYGHAGAVYARHREAREEPYVTFSRAERERSEGLSRQFAAALIDGFRGRDVSVHPYQPVRERIIRRGRSFVPAVLRCNVVPVEVLIEVANLNNPPDSRALADPVYRQRVAQAYVDALQAYFSAPKLSQARPQPAAGR